MWGVLRGLLGPAGAGLGFRALPLVGEAAAALGIHARRPDPGVQPAQG